MRKLQILSSRQRRAHYEHPEATSHGPAASSHQTGNSGLSLFRVSSSHYCVNKDFTSSTCSHLVTAGHRGNNSFCYHKTAKSACRSSSLSNENSLSGALLCCSQFSTSSLISIHPQSGVSRSTTTADHNTPK